MALQLYIGNKNYSSWSMRPWVLLTGAGIPFEEKMVRFDSFDAQSAFKSVVAAINPVGKVPVLVDDGFAVWDTLAIAEYLAGHGAEHHLRGLRQRFRSQVAHYSNAMAKYFPDGTKVTRPTGGHMLWVELPQQVDTLHLARKALRAGIGIMPGRVFAPGERYLNCFRLNCGFALDDRLESKLAELGHMAARAV